MERTHSHPVERSSIRICIACRGVPAASKLLNGLSKGTHPEAPAIALMRFASQDERKRR